MSGTKNVAITVMLIAALYLLGSCARDQLKVEPIPRSENPIEHINRLDNDIRNARKNQVNVLAPTWFTKADRSLKDAKVSLEHREEPSKVLQKVADGRGQLQRAEEIARLGRTTLGDTIKARDLARAAGATRLGEDYAEVEARFLSLTRAIENNEMEWARGAKGKVTRAFDQLELRAIKGQTLTEVRKLIEQGEKAGARKIVPETFAVAQAKLTEADTFISKHRYKKTIHSSPNTATKRKRYTRRPTRRSFKLGAFIK
jgi:hypothetical protein